MEMKSPLDRKNVFSRLISMFIDFIIIILVSYFVTSVAFSIVKSSNKDVKSYYEHQQQIMIDTKLVNYDVKYNQLYSYSVEECFSKEGDNYLILNHLEYFYVTYTEEYDVPTYYEEILEIEKYDFYKVDEGKNITFDESKTFDKEGKVLDTVSSVVMNKYNSAINHCYELKAYVFYQNKIQKVYDLVFNIDLGVFIVIFTILIPLLLKGNSLGLKFMKLQMVSDYKTPEVSWKQTFLHGILLITFPVYLYFITGLLQLIYPLSFLAVCIILMIISPKHKNLLDYISDTHTVFVQQ